ncbi:hypothetical protein BDP27DRAFT_1299116 [Rhodocollybia butyracea]|uniref:Uncharacterized protein n=1 Tax=Rhodocollybia butyracea TaxID=206335 RepID=A0A9P5PF72_9AGAR|nr:hypothetical protein BDP27DRAFT_1299116 [Rhodocollybia butyracea]
MFAFLSITRLLLLNWLATTRASQFVSQFNVGNDLEIRPSPNDTANLVFNTVHSLLLGWPHRRYKNGHTIVPGIIPPGTSLYHGAGIPEIPATPEWTALDSELSTLYCGLFSMERKGCWHLTLTVERPLKVLYFDGYSSLKFLDGPGTIDSQDVIAWEKVIPGKNHAEQERIVDLCRWGEKFKIDGFVRLHTTYEVMLCDFSAGLRLDSMHHIKIPYSPLQPENNSLLERPKMQIGVPLDVFGMGEIIASRRLDEYPGETRVQLYLHRLVSFYDLSISPSLAEQRFGQHRLQHRILGISQSDIHTVKARVESAVDGEWSNPTSGLDWASLFHTTVQRYADRLELVQLDLNTATRSSKDLFLRMRAVFLQLRGMTQPYDFVAAHPIIDGCRGEKSWALPVYNACATAYPLSLSAQITFTPSERLMLSALQATTREICRTITSMWADGVNHQIGNKQNDSEFTITLQEIHEKWKKDINSLISWLDWSVWLKCKPACSTNEMCYLPISPYLIPGETPAVNESDWLTQAQDPHPTCIPRHSR